MDDWLPGYERVTVTGCTGPGSYRDGYPWRWVAHTTESPAGSMPGIISFFQANPCSTPHFAIDPATGRKVQFIPLSWSAAALRGGQGGVETNRAHCIQTEIIGYAKDQAGRSPAEIDFIGDHVAAIVAAGVPLNLGHVHPTTGENGYGERGAVRMTPTQWRAFDGICGHSAVPFNDHWDPGRLDLASVARRAAGTTPTPPVPEEDDMPKYRDWERADQDALAADVARKVGELLSGRAKAQGQAWAFADDAKQIAYPTIPEAVTVTNLGSAAVGAKVIESLKAGGTVAAPADVEAVARATADELAERLKD